MEQQNINRLIAGDHIRQTYNHPECSFALSHWLHGDEKILTSILVLSAGPFEVRIDTTPRQLRALADLLSTQADQVEQAAQAITDRTIDGNIKAD